MVPTSPVCSQPSRSAAAYANGPVSARVQTQFYLARSFRGPGRDPRNDFEGYNLTDAFVRYQTSLGGISLAVQNLFDEQYISYASDTQRPTDNFFNFAGRGRTFTLGDRKSTRLNSSH